MRRDLINAEISNLRDLLPLPPSTRQRLSQLQLMALVCVYVRKINYFQQGKQDLTYVFMYIVLILLLFSYTVHIIKTLHPPFPYRVKFFLNSFSCSKSLFKLITCIVILNLVLSYFQNISQTFCQLTFSHEMAY